MRDQDDVAQGRDRAIGVELEAGVVDLGRLAGDLDEHDRVGRCRFGAWRVPLQRPVDHRTIRERRQTDCLDVDPQIGGVHATRAIFHRLEQRRDHTGRERRVILGPACHRIDLTVDELVLGGAVALDRRVLSVRITLERPAGHSHAEQGSTRWFRYRRHLPSATSSWAVVVARRWSSQGAARRKVPLVARCWSSQGAAAAARSRRTRNVNAQRSEAGPRHE